MIPIPLHPRPIPKKGWFSCNKMDDELIHKTHSNVSHIFEICQLFVITSKLSFEIFRSVWMGCKNDKTPLFQIESMGL